jgi:RNA polymerase sigma factor (sigma-70 family)
MSSPPIRMPSPLRRLSRSSPPTAETDSCPASPTDKNCLPHGTATTREIGTTVFERSEEYPPCLAQLLEARDAAASDQAWSEFVQQYSCVLLQVVRPLVHDYDLAMDRYAYILDRLFQDGCSRLRGYAPRPGVGFSSWLKVVARRLCIDYYRQRYGRARPSGRPGEGHEPSWAVAAARTTRRRLADFSNLSDAIDDVDAISMDETTWAAPDVELASAERRHALAHSIERLEPRDRQLLRLRFEDERSVGEIASALGMATPFHVYRRLRIVLARLAAELHALGVYDASG